MSKLKKSLIWLGVGIIFIVIGGEWWRRSQVEENFLSQPTADSPVEENRWQWLQERKKFYQQEDAEIDSTLKELGLRFPEADYRLQAIAFLQLDTPYQLGCLGEGSGLDPDPFFRLDKTDCTVFILTSTALLHASDMEEARTVMKSVGYCPGREINYQNRLHFTTDRILSSPWFQDITEEIAGGEKVKTKEVILNKTQADGSRLIDIPWEKKMTEIYLPLEEIETEVFQNLPAVVGVAFLKAGDEEIGLDVRHEGLLFNGQTLFHASSLQGKVVTEDFLKYCFPEQQARFSGIIFYKIN